MSLLVVGSVAFDSVQTARGAVHEAIGGSATYFSIAASYFTDVNLVAVVGDDFGSEQRAVFDDRPINLAGLAAATGKTFRWSGRYSEDFNQAFTLDTQLNVFEHFRPVIPDSFRDAEFVFLANIDPDLQLDVLNQIHRPKFTACDTMNFWISGKLPALKQVISRVDLLVVNDQEIRALSGKQNVMTGAREVMAWGPRCIVVKRGEFGALLCFQDDFIFAPAFPVTNVIDTTGAGDTFGGGLMGYLAKANTVNRQSLATGMAVGATLASFNVESFSVDRLKSLTHKDITDRYEQLRNACSFGPLWL